MPPPPNQDEPQFLSTVPLQDPTLRTPGSEIPEAIYASSDAESFRLKNLPASPTRRDSPRLAVALTLLLLAILAAIALYLYRNSHPAPPSPTSAPRSYQKSSPDSSTDRIETRIAGVLTKDAPRGV